MRRYIMTGAPGAGKTTILAALRSRGYAVVDEAATDVIAAELAQGRDRPSHGPSFVDDVARLQRERQNSPTPPEVAIQLYDRSPICTYALARYLGVPIPPALANEVNRVVGGQIYQPQVFFVDMLGFVTPSAARRISLEDAVRFGKIHQEVYRAHGYDLIDVPAGPVEERVALVHRYLRTWRERPGPAGSHVAGRPGGSLSPDLGPQPS